MFRIGATAEVVHQSCFLVSGCVKTPLLPLKQMQELADTLRGAKTSLSGNMIDMLLNAK